MKRGLEVGKENESCGQQNHEVGVPTLPKYHQSMSSIFSNLENLEQAKRDGSSYTGTQPIKKSKITDSISLQPTPQTGPGIVIQKLSLQHCQSSHSLNIKSLVIEWTKNFIQLVFILMEKAFIEARLITDYDLTQELGPIYLPLLRQLKIATIFAQAKIKSEDKMSKLTTILSVTEQIEKIHRDMEEYKAKEEDRELVSLISDHEWDIGEQNTHNDSYYCIGSAI